MKASLLAALLLFITSIYAYTVDPPATAPSDTIQDCTNWVVVSATETCQGIADDNGITLAQFDTYNPSQNSACNLIVGDSYSIEENFGVPPPTSSISSTPTSTGLVTPTPHQTGIFGNCDSFYLVQSGDQCGTIASSHGISLANFYAWNPAVGSTCTSLIDGDYVCVNIVGGTTLTTSTAKTPTNGINSKPIQTGMTTNCNTFYLVKSGDQCVTIASSPGVSLANFYSWNSAVGSTCATLIAGDYVCVNVIGGTTTTASKTTSTKGNGVSTPTSTQSGMVTNCKTFHDVVSGDECGTIASNAGITLAQFYSWNPSVGVVARHWTWGTMSVLLFCETTHVEGCM